MLESRLRLNRPTHRKQRRKDGPMTVCVAAACESGKQVVCATDGLLSFAGITADVMLGKIYFINEWLFMYAGEPSQSQLILEEMYFVRKERGEPLNRENIQSIASEAYDRRMGKVCSIPVLRAINWSLADFKREGPSVLGKNEFGRLMQEIENKAANFMEQLLVIGWGAAERACMIYEVGPSGDADHGLDGMAAIGSGAEVALSTMLLLGQSRNSMLPETLYAVAAAKFSAEKSQGQDVGPKTSMYVCEKHKEGEPFPPGKWVQPDEIGRLRTLWEQYGKPRIPDEAYKGLAAITKAVGYEARISGERMVSIMRSLSEKPEGA